MSYTVYTMKELREAKQEFQARMGQGVEAGNKKNSADALKDMAKDAKNSAAYGDFPVNKTVPIGDNGDYNKTTLDIEFTVEPPKEFKDKVKAQVHGYPSVQNEKDNDIEGTEGNKKFYDDAEDRNKEIAKQKETIKKSGLAAREMPASTFKSNTMFKENKAENNSNSNKNIQEVKKLTFKNARFLSEEHMLSYVPDKYKVDGQRLIMCDKDGQEYQVEWSNDNQKKINEAIVVEMPNQKRLDEQFALIHKLMNYKPNDAGKSLTTEAKANEVTGYKSFLDKVRKKSEEAASSEQEE